MRSVAIGLLALTGCNQIFGLDSVTIADAQGQIDIITEPSLPTVQLTFMVAKTTNDSKPAAAIEFPPIGDLQSVRIGPQDGDLVATQYTADGGVEVFPGLSGTPWRMEYTRTGQVPVEVQWSAVVGNGRFVDPIFGRLERTAIPANSGYSLTVTSAPAFNQPHMLASGIWYDTALTGALPFQVAMDQVAPLSGPRGAPSGDDAFNDTLFLANYNNLSGCKRITGSAAYIEPPALTGTFVAPQPTPAFGTANSHTPIFTYDAASVGAASLRQRLETALSGGDTRVTPNASSRAMLVLMPHAEMPVFTNRLASVPPAFGLPWLECAVGVVQNLPPVPTGTYGSPPGLAGFPHLAYASMSNTRTFGPDMESSIVGTAVAPSTNEIWAPDFNVPFAIHPIKLGDLFISMSGGQFLLGTGQFELTFELENTPATLRADYVEAVLYRIPATNTLVPERVYVLSDPSRKKIVVDQSVFTSNTDYVFAIRVFRGRPMAASNDFTDVSQPQSVSTVFTHIFHAI
ncbi:MAG: hypothetical protein ABI867_02515 [Kofleriaceae bacterium]